MTTLEIFRMEIAKLEMTGDDVLVVRMGQKITDATRAQIQDTVRHACPGRKVMIVDPGTDFLLLRKRSIDAEPEVVRPSVSP